jgi:hypothetical protein
MSDIIIVLSSMIVFTFGLLADLIVAQARNSSIDKRRE